MRALIFESNWQGGHYLQHVAVLAQALRGLGVEVVLALPAPAPSGEPYRVHIAPLSGASIDCSLPDVMPLSFRQRAVRKAGLLRDAIARHAPDWVYLPSGDGVMQVIALRHATLRRVIPRGVGAETLINNGAIAYPQVGLRARLRVRASWALARSGPWTQLHCIDPLVYEHQRRRCRGAAATRVLAMPEPIEPMPALDRAEARARLGAPSDARIIASAGRMDSRKGSDLLIRAFLRMPRAADDRLLLVGPVDAAVRDLLAGEARAAVESRAILVRDAFVSDEELLATFIAGDVVAVPYRLSHTSSGIATRAVAAGRPVVGPDRGFLGTMIERFGLGAGCDVENLDALGATLRRMLDAAPGWSPPESARRLVAYHTIANFQAHWTRRIRAALESGDSPALRSWEWANGLSGDLAQ